MHYAQIPIPYDQMPRAVAPAYQHVIDIYAGETNKTASVWRMFTDAELAWRPHPRSSSIEEIVKHQLLSERRFFAEFLGSTEPAGAEVLPARMTIDTLVVRLVQLASTRLGWLCTLNEAQWLQEVNFFDVRRERIWVFWRRVLHSAYHRTQLTVYLRLLNKPVPSTYGPTADFSWEGADPTLTVEAAERH